jgi:hypothetical protein
MIVRLLKNLPHILFLLDIMHISRSRGPVEVRDPALMFYVLLCGVVTPPPNPQAAGQFILGCRLIIQQSAATLRVL